MLKKQFLEKRVFENELIESKLKLRGLWKQLWDLCRKSKSCAENIVCLEGDNISLFDPKDVKDFKTFFMFSFKPTK